MSAHFDPDAFSEDSRAGWSEAAPRYRLLSERLFGEITETFVDFAAPRSGERVLDVATGPGAAARAAAARVGPAGRVLGVDFAEPMIRLAAERAGETPWLSFAPMDAERLACADASFDLVLCQLGVMLFARPERALAEMRRVARPEGRVCCLVQGTAEGMRFTSLLMRAVLRRAPQLKQPGAPSLFGFGDPGTLAGALRAAGLSSVEERRLSGAFAFADAREYWETLVEGAGRTARVLRRLSPADQESVRREVEAEASAFRAGSGIAVPYEFVMAKGVKP